jgi:pyridoxal phosphate enzyme (YggS family)
MLTVPQNLPPYLMPSQNTANAAYTIADRLQTVRRQIHAAAVQYGRDPQSIRLLAVSKTHPADALRAAAAQGQVDFGESYLQEAVDKQAVLADLPLTWHYIGQIQSNKTRPIAEHFSWVHTVDRLKIAERLSAQRPAGLPPLNVCIQVKLADEAGKGGAWPGEVEALAQAVASLPNLSLRGLMCIPPPSDEFETQRGYFAQLAALLQHLNQKGLTLDTLSMGMSGDLNAAIAAGATLVRVGTAIFGERHRDA